MNGVNERNQLKPILQLMSIEELLNEIDLILNLRLKPNYFGYSEPPVEW